MALKDQRNNRIVLRQETRIMETKKFEAETLPGMIVEPSASDNDVMKPHGTVGGNVGPVQVAEMNYLLGNEISVPYAEGDRGPVPLLRSGDKFLCVLADGNTYSQGDYLMSNGDGKLTKFTAEATDSSGGDTTSYPNRIVARLLEDRNLSDSSGGDDSQWARCEVA